jgi:hypothetical protein
MNWQKISSPGTQHNKIRKLRQQHLLTEIFLQGRLIPHTLPCVSVQRCSFL